MADLRKHSSTSNLIRFTLKHSTTGQGLTGLTSASSGLIISTIADNEATATAYTVAGSTIETIATLGNFAAPTATKCRFKEIDATNHPGLYEFQFADARFSVASAKRLVISVSGATNLLGTDYEIQLGFDWNPSWDAEVESEVDDALIAKGLDHLVFASVTGTDIADNSIVARLASKSATADWDSYVNTTDSLEAISDAAAGLTTATGAGDLATKTADSATLTTGSNTSGSYTDTATDDNTYWITAPVTPAVGGFGLRQQLVFNLDLARVPVSILIRGWWNGSGATGEVYALNARTGVYDKLTNTGTNLATRSAELLYVIPLPRDYSDDSGGVNNVVTIEFRSTSTNTAHRLRLDQVLVTHLSEATAASVVAPTAEQIWSYVSRTLTVPGSDPPTPLDAAGVRAAVGLASANLDTQLDALPTNSELTTALAAADDAVLAAIAALNNLSAAQVNAEVVDALNVDTYAEIGQENPAATTTIRKMLAYLYKAFRNKSDQTATKYQLYADDGTTVDQKKAVSDNGTTYTSGELETGP